MLQHLVDHDLSTAAFPFMSFAPMDVGLVPALVGRVSFTGEMGYELWVTSEYLRTLYDLLHDAGKVHGLKNFGGRALNSLRLEKSFGNWAREFRPIYGPYEAGLGRFVHLDKGDFVTVIGSNGAGKSTLFNAIAGSFYVDEGCILLNGKDITFTREHDRSRVIGRYSRRRAPVPPRS